MIDWKQVLKDVVPGRCNDRPFVCDGCPDASCTIIIGENPATKMRKDWWDYWDTDNCFNLKKFLADYIKERVEAGNRPMSNTRLRLGRFRENGVCGVETNVYRNEQSGGAGKGVWNYAVLDKLIQNMPRLCAIVAHGSVAHAFIDGYKPDIEGVKIFRLRHFRMESYDVIDGICGEIRAMCKYARAIPPCCPGHECSHLDLL